MTEPQGPDPNQQWASPPSGQPAEGQEQPSGSSEEHAGQDVWQQPAYTQQQYPPYQPPSTPPYAAPQQYPATDQFGQVPQYGPPGQYAQPGQFGQAPEYRQQPEYGQPTGAEQGSKRSLAVIGGIVGVLAAIIIAVVLVLGFWKPGFFVTTKLDVNKAQAGVQQVLTDETNGYGAKNVKDVKCNNGQNPTVKKGDSFNCEVSIDGTKRQVTVTFQDDNGTYEVGRPK